MKNAMSDTNSSPTARQEGASTQTLDIGGRRRAFACTGQGSPTVVLETGLGAESAEWAAVARGVASFARVFSYDRAGRGASDSAPGPRTARAMVDDLHGLLGAASIPGPYVLVGHSLGGLLMRVYAQRYRSEIVGLVLVELDARGSVRRIWPGFPSGSPLRSTGAHRDPPVLD